MSSIEQNSDSSAVKSFLNNDTPVQSNWSDTLKTSSLKTLLAGKSSLTHADMLAMFNAAVPEGGSVTPDLMDDLQYLVKVSKSLLEPLGSTKAEYISYLLGQIVNGSLANAQFTGGGPSPQNLGNLSSEMSKAGFDQLWQSWLLGSDMPAPEFGGDTANPAAKPQTGTYATYTQPLFTANGALATEVQQGGMGDCYLLAAMIALTDTKPGLIESMFVDMGTFGGNRLWGVRFYDGDGKPVWVTVNDKLPSRDGSSDLAQLMIGKSGDAEGEIWVPMLEKAYTQLNETGVLARKNAGKNVYSAIEGGFGDAMQTLAGGARVVSYADKAYAYPTKVIQPVALPVDETGAPIANGTDSLETFKSEIIAAVNSGKSVWLGSGKATANPETLVKGHAFALLDPNKAQPGDTTFSIVNPWAPGDHTSPFPLPLDDGVRNANEGANDIIDYILANGLVDISVLDPVSTLAPVSGASEATQSAAKAAKVLKASAAETPGITKAAIDQASLGSAGDSREPQVVFIGPSATVYVDNGVVQLLSKGSTFASKKIVSGFTENLQIEGSTYWVVGASFNNTTPTTTDPLSSAAGGFTLLLRDQNDATRFKTLAVSSTGTAAMAGTLPALTDLAGNDATAKALTLYGYETGYGEDFNGSGSVGSKPWVLGETEAGRPVYVDAAGAIVLGGAVQGGVFTTAGVKLNQGALDLRFADLAAAGYDILWIDEVGTGYEIYLEDQHEGSILRLNFAPNGELTFLETAFVYDETLGDYVDVSSTFFGDVGNNTLDGGLRDDYIDGGAGNDRLSGLDGNDILNGGGGDDRLDGGAGIDTAFFQLARSNYTVAISGSSTTITSKSGSEGVDTVTNIERLSFSDGAVALDLSGTAGKAYRVIKAAFNRDPMKGDTSGLGYWIGQMDGAMDLIEVSARFVDSKEFRDLYGTSPTNAQFLTKLYQNVLGRAPEAAGYNWWLNELNTNPSKTKAKVLADFAESAENQTGVASLIGNGITYEPWVG